jgi:hypothetical protein
VQEFTYKTLRLHDERKLGAIKGRSWVEGNVTIILQKNRKLKKIEQLDEYGRGIMQITKTTNIE